jgi:hypothetical protein
MTADSITYQAEPYTGRSIGIGYMHRKGWQLVAYTTGTEKRRRAFGNKFTLKLPWIAYHYKSGFSKINQERYDQQREEIKLLEKHFNNN